jgi:hypothetical protein
MVAPWASTAVELHNGGKNKQSLVKSIRKFVDRHTALHDGQITCRGSGWLPGMETTHVLVLLTDSALAALMCRLIGHRGRWGPLRERFSRYHASTCDGTTQPTQPYQVTVS